MKNRLALILFVIGAIGFAMYYRAAESRQIESANQQLARVSGINPQSVKAAAFGVSGKISDFAPAAKRENPENQIRVIGNKEIGGAEIPNPVHDADASLVNFSALTMPAPLLSFDGISNKDNNDTYGFAVVPPDANGDVGPNHFFQSVNILSRIFDKSGNPLTAPFKLSDIFGNLGTPCSREDDGEPIVLYDSLADRWILSQYCNLAPPFRQMIAVSKTGDPTGAYFLYEFVMPNIKLNDYAKFGVWTDAYYMSDEQFIGSDFAGNGVFAFDKKRMLAGDQTAGYIYFDLPSDSIVRRRGFLPSDLDGLNAPPANAPNVFVSYTANEYGDAADALRLFGFHADFTYPPNSTFTERAESPLPVVAFDPTSPDGRGDIAQPAPGELLDSQSDRLMSRAAYRNFGTGESIVVNQTVRVSAVGQTYRAGARLYELRKSTTQFAVREQTTIGDLTASRWIGSAAQDWQGNLAIGYSFASEIKRPSILYTGKLASEPAGTFRAEATLVSGSGVQSGFGSRWGDYSQLTVDPSDDCTFWLTNEYYTAESQTIDPLNWLTRIGKFKFEECPNAPRATIIGAVRNAATNEPIEGATVTANQVYIRNTSANGNYGNLLLVPNTYVLTATASGFRSQTLTVTLANGQTLTQNFALQPTAVLEHYGYQVVSESCATNGAIDPGETVTLNVFLRNTGAKATTNLIATLLPIGGVISAGASQNYGALNVNDLPAARQFTFTVSPNLRCGDALTLTFQLNDAGENLGTVSFFINTGAPRIALQENFDAVAAPNLPAGWTTSASGAQSVWRTSTTAFQSAPNAAFSAAAGQAGINELVSPVFRINSPNANLLFYNRYDLETTFLRNKLYDGAVLEIKIGNNGSGRFQDILTAGGAFNIGGYDGVLESCCQNPLAGRLAWSGKSGINETPSFVPTSVNFPASAAGKNVQLRWRVGTDNGTPREGQFVDGVSVFDGYTCACQIASQQKRAPFDFDGDGKTDLSVFRPSDSPNEADFFVQNSSNNASTNAAFGSVGDVAVNADFDGDGKTDFAVFRPSNGNWFILKSSDNTISAVQFGASSDKFVPADFDGDGKADIAVYRPSTGVWYILQSSSGQIRAVQLGAVGDLTAQADYDGDGKIDVAVFRPSNGVWYVRKSSNGELSAVQFGASGDQPIAGDFDGDGKADFAVFRPSNGNWYLQKTTQGFAAVQFGASGDKPLQADFDGDGRRDLAVYRPSNRIWYFLKSTDAAFVARQFGVNGDSPLPSIFVP